MIPSKRLSNKPFSLVKTLPLRREGTRAGDEINALLTTLYCKSFHCVPFFSVSLIKGQKDFEAGVGSGTMQAEVSIGQTLDVG